MGFSCLQVYGLLCGRVPVPSERGFSWGDLCAGLGRFGNKQAALGRFEPTTCSRRVIGFWEGLVL
jgi:hypothetical protein